MFILELQCNQIDTEKVHILLKLYGKLLLTIDLRTNLNCSIPRVFAIFQILSYSTYYNLLFPGAGTHKEIGLLQ